MASSTRRLTHVSSHLASASPATTASVLKWVKGLFSGEDAVAATSGAPVESDVVAVCAHADFPHQHVSGGHVCVLTCLSSAPCASNSTRAAAAWNRAQAHSLSNRMLMLPEISSVQTPEHRPDCRRHARCGLRGDGESVRRQGRSDVFSQQGWEKLVEPEADPEHTIHSTSEGPRKSP